MDSDKGVIPLDNQTFDARMANHNIDIYFYTASPPCRATLMLMKALGLKPNVKVINILQKEQLSPEFLKLNPMHTLPTVKDDDFVVWDSHVIMKYLVDQYAKDDSFYPKDPKRGAVVSQRLYFEATMLFPRFTAYVMPVIMNDEKPDPEKWEKLEEAFSILSKFLDNQIWVAGQYLTIADISIIAVISTAEQCGISFSKYPNIVQWYQRAKKAMFAFGYEEVNQPGADAFGAIYRSKIQK